MNTSKASSWKSSTKNVLQNPHRNTSKDLSISSSKNSLRVSFQMLFQKLLQTKSWNFLKNNTSDNFERIPGRKILFNLRIAVGIFGRISEEKLKSVPVFLGRISEEKNPRKKFCRNLWKKFFRNSWKFHCKNLWRNFRMFFFVTLESRNNSWMFFFLSISWSSTWNNPWWNCLSNLYMYKSLGWFLKEC